MAWRAIYSLGLIAMALATLVIGLAHGIVVAQNALAWSNTIILGLATTLVGYGMFTIVEKLMTPAGPVRALGGYILNSKLLVAQKMTDVVWGALAGTVIASIGNSIGLGLIDLRFVPSSNSWLMLPAVILWWFIFDFFYYWLHRFQHENAIMWPDHKIHHLDRELSAFFRQGFLEQFFRTIAVLVPMAVIFRLDGAQGGILGTLTAFWATFAHANVRIGFGAFNRVLTSPQIHRIHHSVEDRHINRNYAEFFPIWDIMFGTYYHPQPDEYPVTGIKGEDDIGGVWEAARLPFSVWHAMFRDWRGRQAPPLRMANEETVE